MNFLAHAAPYLHEPWVAIGSCVPDWLSAVDRKIRARRRMAEEFLDSGDEVLASVATGICHHIDDDRWFHGSEAFTTMNLQLAVELRDLLPGDRGFRPMFVGHILIEMLLDAHRIRRTPEVCDRFYEILSSADHEQTQAAVNKITGRPTDKLVDVIQRFTEIEFLRDYLDVERLLFRLNQVMKRVKLDPLPTQLSEWLLKTDTRVGEHYERLLAGPQS
ncbi:MAG: hypothetical protein AAF664_16410 [Planctomycetota bacterium]